MSKIKSTKQPKRQYPPFWEKFIPVAVIIITVIIILLVFITIRVALGMEAFSI